MMVYLLDLQSILWFITKPLVDHVGEMKNVMETTQLYLFLEIQISPFGAPMVCLDLQVVEFVEQLNPPTMVLVWPHVMGLESLQLVQVIMPPSKVVVVLVWYGMPRLLG
jgi:hypothetical protein